METILPPEIQVPVATADPRTMVALSERVAVVETKVSALKEDTVAIRQVMHQINQEMQRSVAVELRCAQALEALQAEAIDRKTQMERMHATIDTLSTAKHMAEGAWGATVRISAAIVASISILSAIGGGAAWALGHLVLK